MAAEKVHCIITYGSANWKSCCTTTHGMKSGICIISMHSEAKLLWYPCLVMLRMATQIDAADLYSPTGLARDSASMSKRSLLLQDEEQNKAEASEMVRTLLLGRFMPLRHDERHDTLCKSSNSS